MEPDADEGCEATNEYEKGKYNNIQGHPGGDDYIPAIVGPNGPKTVAKTGNASVRGGYPDQHGS